MTLLASQIGTARFFDSDIILPRQVKGVPIRIENLAEIKLAFQEQLPSPTRPLAIARNASMRNDQTYQLDGETLYFSNRLLENDQDAIATLLHQLSRNWFLQQSGNSWSPDELDWYSDLLPVYLGWGIFGANTTVFSRSDRIGEFENWQVDRHRILTSRMFGYGIALFAWGHNERAPDWHRLLRPDAKIPFQRMLKYLWKTDDSYFQPATLTPPAHDNSRDLYRKLESSSNSILISTLWEIQSRGVFETDFIAPIANCLRHRDPCVRYEALNTLGLGKTLPDAVIQRVARLMSDSSEQVRAAAVTLIGSLQTRENEDVYGVGHLLLDTCEIVVKASADAITSLAPSDEYLSKNLQKALRKSLVHCNFELARALVRASVSLKADTTKTFDEFFKDDPEMRNQARVIMEQETDQC